MNIYFGSLSHRVKESELEQVLSAYGAVAYVKIIKDRETGRSKGFGFAEMEEPAATQAIHALNGSGLTGRQMVVKEATPR